MPSVVWTCPVCQRRVPLRVDECWCGFKRGDAERHAAEEADKQSPGAARELIGIAVVLALGLGLYVQRSSSDRPSDARPGAQPAGLSVPRPDPAPVAQPSTGHEQLAPRESASPTPSPSPSASPLPAAAAPAPTLVLPGIQPSPSLEAAGSTADERRASGLQALQQAYTRVASQGQELASLLSSYESGCVGRHSGTVVGNCEQIQGSLAREARDLLESLASAEDEARRAWVRPGDLRTLRQRHAVEGAEETARRALRSR